LGRTLSFGFLDGAGINATALTPGNEVIEFAVISKISNKQLGTAKKYLEVIKEIDITFPTIIGHQ
jgi:hypothetical protein